MLCLWLSRATRSSSVRHLNRLAVCSSLSWSDMSLFGREQGFLSPSSVYYGLSHLRQNYRNVIGYKEPNTVLYSASHHSHRRYIILIYRRRPYIIFVFGFPSLPVDGILVRSESLFSSADVNK